MADPDTSLNQSQRVTEAQEKSVREAELAAWDERGHLRRSMKQYLESEDCYQNVAIARNSRQSVQEDSYRALGRNKEMISDREMYPQVSPRPCSLLQFSIIKKVEKYDSKYPEKRREFDNREAKAEAYSFLGNRYVKENSPESDEKAFECFKEQLNGYNNIGDKEGSGNAYSNLGALSLKKYLKEKSTGRKQEAESYFINSLKMYDSFFENSGEDDERKINVIESYIYVHKNLAELYIEAEEFDKALVVAEQECGRALADILKKRYKLNFTNKLKQRFYDFQGQYDDIESKILSQDTSILFFSELNMTRSNFEFQVGTWVLDKNNKVVPFYLNELKSLLQKEDLDEGAQKRPKDILDELVNKAYTTISVQRSVDCEDRSFSFHGDTGTKSSSTLDTQDSNKNPRCVYGTELNEDYLKELYKTLIEPVHHRLIRDEIVIIPHGPLFKVPFAALRNPQTGEYLSETKRLRIAPSLTTLTIMKESPAKSHSLTGALIVGNPDVKVKRILRGQVRSLDSLPNAQVEAEKVGEVLGVKALTGKQASKQVIIERLRQGVAVIHFAAHGCAETGKIILCPSPDHPTGTTPEEEDYLLKISDVQELDKELGLRARLVVLSCCHSGRGEIKSEGVIGMSRAFLAAGALAVVASLWAVDDEGTRVFMERFYTHLKDGKTASTSLQQAMKDMRNMPRFNKPSYWAPFVLIGEDVTINLN